MHLDRNSIKRHALTTFNRLASSSPVSGLLDRRTLSAQDLREGDSEWIVSWEYGSAESGFIEEPRPGSDFPEAVRKKVGPYRVEPPFVAEVREAQLVGPSALPILPDGTYLFENSLRSHSLLLRSLSETVRAGMAPRRRTTTNTVDIAVSLVGPWCRGYFHWFADWLPRLEGVVEYSRQTRNEPSIVVPPNPPNWMTSSLELVGFDPDRWIEWEGGRLDVSRLIVPSIRRGSAKDDPGYIHAPGGFRWIRDRILSNLDGTEEVTPRELYISRDDAAERRVVNESELVDLLASHGYQRVVLSELPFEDQVRLFRQARRVVAPHGAGLVNIAFGDGLDVVELFGSYVNACYFVLADSFGFEYRCRTCTPRGSDIYADVDSVSELLE